MADTFAGGTRAVVETLAAGLDVRLGSPVAAIEQRDDDVVVRDAGGAEIVAGAVVVAVPVNVWAQIAFEPALSAEKLEVARGGHPNRMGKVWALVSGAPADAAAFGPSSELLYLAPEYPLPDGLLMVGFSSPPHLLDVTDPAAIERAVREHHPAARVIAADAHDWNADPWSRGGWMTYRPGQASRLMSSLAARRRARRVRRRGHRDGVDRLARRGARVGRARRLRGVAGARRRPRDGHGDERMIRAIRLTHRPTKGASE